MRYLKFVCRCMASMLNATKDASRAGLRSISDGILGRIGRREHLVLYPASFGGLSLLWRPNGLCKVPPYFLRIPASQLLSGHR